MTDDREPFREAVLKTPEEWCRIEGVEILDRDGWRGHNGRPWTDTITLAEFRDRLVGCTMRHVVEVDDRATFKARRDAGLKARQERRLENATYTAADVKVLTADACKVAAEAGRRIGRKELFDELDVAFDRITYASDDGTEYEHNDGCQGEPECPACWVQGIRGIIAEFREPIATSGRTDPSVVQAPAHPWLRINAHPWLRDGGDPS